MRQRVAWAGHAEHQPAGGESQGSEVRNKRDAEQAVAEQSRQPRKNRAVQQGWKAGVGSMQRCRHHG